MRLTHVDITPIEIKITAEEILADLNYHGAAPSGGAEVASR